MRPEELLLHADFVRRLSRSLVFDEHRTADLAQETLAAALEKPPPSEDFPKAWFARVARNIARNLLRGEVRRIDRERAAARPDRVPSAAAVAEREEIRRRVVDAVLGLPESYRSVILLRFYEGLPPRKAAKELGIPVETVKTRIKRGLALLRERLDADHRGDRRKWIIGLAPFAMAAPSPSAAILTGIFAMSAKTKILTAAVLLLGITLSLFLLLPEDRERFSTEPTRGDRVSQEETSASFAIADEAPEMEINLTKKQAVASGAPTLKLSGRICSRVSGLGIEGAKVSARVLPIRSDLPKMTARTDKAGGFSMTVDALGDVEIYAVNFRVSAEGYRDLETPLPWEGKALERSGLSFHLDETRTYAFKVLDMSGGPVARAKVEFFSPVKNRTMAVKFADFDGMVRVQDQDLGWVTGYMVQDWIVFRATAPGMAPLLAGFKTDLTEVRMSPEGIWTCRITDSDTKEGIAGAHVLVHSSDNPKLDAWLGFEGITTDGSGVFRMPRFTLAWRFNLLIRVWAPGYMTKVSSLADFMMNLADSMMNKSGRSTGLVEETVLRPTHLVKTIRAIDAASGKPIPGLEIHLCLNYDSLRFQHEDTFVTDERGCFECPFLRQERNYLSLRAQGYCDVFRPFPHPDAMREDPWPLRLRAQAPERVQIVDAFDRPVPGIRVQLVQPSEDGNASWSDRFADGEGIVEINPSFIPPGTKVWFRIFGDGLSNNFAPFRTEPFVVGASDGKIRKIILRRGTLLQNIRVVDGNGGPMKGQKVVASLNVGKGMTMAFDGRRRVGAITDQQGCCDMAFPPFLDGIIGVGERPDTNVPIAFEDVVDQKEITLVMGSSYLSHSGIRGRVFDDTGYPLDDLTIHLESIEDEGSEPRRPKDERKTVTAPDGTFSTAVERERTYSLRILPFHRKDARGRERWFHGAYRSRIPAGANLEIKLNAWPNHVEVSLKDCGFPAEDCEAWIESEDGNHATVNVVKKNVLRYRSAKGQTADIRVDFYGVPAGKMRALIRTDAGRLFKSDLLEVESGKSISSRLKIDE